MLHNPSSSQKVGEVTATTNMKLLNATVDSDKTCSANEKAEATRNGCVASLTMRVVSASALFPLLSLSLCLSCE